MKKIFACLLTVCLCSAGFAAPASAAASEKAAVTIADGVNVTRWDNFLVVYKDIAATGQNEWGHNIVVNADSQVVRILEGGDAAGKNLAVPAGGMVVSATGEKVEWLKDNIAIGDYVIYDDMTGRVMASAEKDFDLTFSVELTVTDFNAVRYAGTLVVYDRGETTQTNGYGYEVAVGADGVICAAGGNDSAIPAGGYVVSAIEEADRRFLAAYGVPGAKCVLDRAQKKLRIVYGAEEMRQNALLSYESAAAQVAAAKAAGRLFDADAAADLLSSLRTMIDENAFVEYEGRARFQTLLEQVNAVSVESKAAEVRAVWHAPVETTEAAVEKVVKDIYDANLNQLCLGISNGIDTILPLPEDSPFYGKERRLRIDLLKTYSEKCREYGIELIVSVSVFHNAAASAFPQWLTASNAGGGAAAESEEREFYSPASDEYFEAFTSYLTYILRNYEFDGLQLDYIRYPYSDGVLDYGYDETTLALFAEQTGISVEEARKIGEETTESVYWERWIRFKSDLVTARVRALRELTEAERPDLFFSVCLAADTTLRAYCQDGAAWTAAGLVDAVYPMAYAAGVAANASETFSSFDDVYYCILGSGSYLSLTKREQLLQTVQSRENGAAGIAFFEYTTYFSHGYDALLKQGAFSEKAVSPSYDAAGAARACVGRVLERAAANGASEALSAYAEDLAALKDAVSALEGGWTAAALEDIAYAEKALAMSRDAAKAERLASRPKPEEPTDSTDGESTSAAVSVPEAVEKAAVWPYVLAGCALLAAVGLGLLMRKRAARDGK